MLQTAQSSMPAARHTGVVVDFERPVEATTMMPMSCTRAIAFTASRGTGPSCWMRVSSMSSAMSCGMNPSGSSMIS